MKKRNIKLCYKDLGDYFKDIPEEYHYAVVYSEHYKGKMIVMTESFGFPKLREEWIEDDFENTDYFRTEREALKEADLKERITDKDYTVVAILKREDDGTVIAIRFIKQ